MIVTCVTLPRDTALSVCLSVCHKSLFYIDDVARVHLRRARLGLGSVLGRTSPLDMKHEAVCVCARVSTLLDRMESSRCLVSTVAVLCRRMLLLPLPLTTDRPRDCLSRCSRSLANRISRCIGVSLAAELYRATPPISPSPSSSSTNGRTFNSHSQSLCFDSSRKDSKTRGKSGPALGGTEYRLMPSACRLIYSASEIVKFTISIPRESCTNAKAKYSSSVVPPDPSVHFYH